MIMRQEMVKRVLHAVVVKQKLPPATTSIHTECTRERFLPQRKVNNASRPFILLATFKHENDLFDGLPDGQAVPKEKYAAHGSSA